ncbi:MAG: glycoside hydrolase family 127 protein [Clostridia bacterium]|nr:glycoside hydrolase family 127 protein [Clostridia bacterium]
MRPQTVKELDGIRVLTKEAELSMKFERSLAEAVRFLERNQICEVGLWKEFVNIFRRQTDGDAIVWMTWRSEFWGKMMRGACMVLKYTGDDDMYRIVEASVRDILTTQEENGRISGYSFKEEFTRWDLWGRKYVMLGMMYFLEICRDEKLAEELISSMCRQADYILEHVGEGKLDIRKCAKHWEGLNSCSILEPMVRLYRLTGEKRYLEFAEYIISTGFILSGNLVELAYEDKVAPHEYPITKAYEMMSCFEGLLQYYCLTGIEKYKTAVINFGKRIVNGELSIIGCSGCTHELFDHTAVKQTRPEADEEDVIQETCVTVTWMKFAEALLELTGDVTYADAIERSFYNSYIGAMNTHRVPTSNSMYSLVGIMDYLQVLPFDSYSPLVSARRGKRIGGFNFLHNGGSYGCCACIGAAGAGLIPQFALLRSENGIVINYYEQGVIKTQTPTGAPLSVTMETEYPYDGKVSFTFETDVEEEFEIKFRIPAWCEKAAITENGKTVSVSSGYASIFRKWNKGDTVVLELPMPVKQILPPKGAVNEDIFAAYMRGPIVLAADKRITDPDDVLDILCDDMGNVAYTISNCPEIPESKLCLEVSLADGRKVRLIDYASAGKTWTDESRTAAWLYRKPMQ